MPPPLAYYLTWTTYGVWLHGDKRGSFLRAKGGRQAEWVVADSRREAKNDQRLKESPVVLDLDQRRIVDQAIREHCEFRQWSLLALNVRTNHIHVVVACAVNIAPERCASQFKAIATRRLREANLVVDRDRIWTRRESTRYLNSHVAIEKAVRYVVESQ